MESLVTQFAERLSLSTGESAQLLASLVALTVGLLASIGAVISAWMTWRSVKEMRASREQSARPILIFEGTRAEICLNRDVSLDPVCSDNEDGVHFEVRNVGLGPAIDLEMTIDDDYVPYDFDLKRVNEIFSAAQIHALRSNYGIELRDKSLRKLRPARILGDSWPTAFTQNAIPAGEAIKMRLGKFPMQSIFLKAVSAERTRDKLHHIKSISVKYSSLGGVNYSERYYLFISSKPMTFVVGDPPVQYGEIINWTEIRTPIHFYFSQSSKPPLRAKMWYNRSVSYAKSDIANLGMLIERLFRTRDAGFAVGDRVLFRPLADWKVDEESNPYKRPRKRKVTDSWEKGDSDSSARTK